MAECVDRDELLHAIGELPLAWEYGQAVSEIYEIVKNAPTIDPESLRPRGRWETHRQDKSCFVCSECKLNVDSFEKRWLKFCPNCGARMEDEP